MLEIQSVRSQATHCKRRDSVNSDRRLAPSPPPLTIQLCFVHQFSLLRFSVERVLSTPLTPELPKSVAATASHRSGSAWPTGPLILCQRQAEQSRRCDIIQLNAIERTSPTWPKSAFIISVAIVSERQKATLAYVAAATAACAA